MSDKIKVESSDTHPVDGLGKKNLETVLDRAEQQKPHCGFGEQGLCCRHCYMGPCRINPTGKNPQKGVCGATAEVIVARNFARMIAAGTAAHSDHGREVARTLALAAQHPESGYTIKDVQKLKKVAQVFGCRRRDKSKEELALEVARRRPSPSFGQQEGEICLHQAGSRNTAGPLARPRHRPPRHRPRGRGDDAPDDHGRGPGPPEHHAPGRPDGPGGRLGRLDDRHRAPGYPLRHPLARPGQGQPGSALRDATSTSSSTATSRFSRRCWSSRSQDKELIEPGQVAGAPRESTWPGSAARPTRSCCATAFPSPVMSSSRNSPWPPAPWRP